MMEELYLAEVEKDWGDELLNYIEIAKSIVTVLFSVAYLCAFGAVSLEVKFPDNTKISQS